MHDFDGFELEIIGELRGDAAQGALRTVQHYKGDFIERWTISAVLFALLARTAVRELCDMALLGRPLPEHPHKRAEQMVKFAILPLVQGWDAAAFEHATRIRATAYAALVHKTTAMHDHWDELAKRLVA